MMTVTELKQQIFQSGKVNADWENDEAGTLYQIQAQGEFILSELLTKSDIDASQSTELMTKLMASYDSHYPLMVVADLERLPS